VRPYRLVAGREQIGLGHEFRGVEQVLHERPHIVVGQGAAVEESAQVPIGRDLAQRERYFGAVCVALAVTLIVLGASPNCRASR
jgi:hypothetical protein